MSTNWKGMDQKSTPVYPDATLGILAQNQRFRVQGEMQRRPGLAASSLTKLSDPILSMYGGADFSGYLITQTTGTLTGDRDPTMLWGDVRIIPPTVLKGNPVAPVINSITPTPASPGTAGNPASFLASVTYDGLSGALIYNWTSLQQGGFPFGTIAPVNGAVNPAVYNFGPSDFWTGTLFLSTTLNGFSTNQGFGYLTL